MARLAVPAFLLLAATACAAAATIAVEHSLDGGKIYLPAGAITLSTSSKSVTAILERTALSAEQQAALDALVAADGALYRLRLPASGVAASFPAHCLAAAAAPGGMELDLLQGGHVAAISVAAPCRRGGGTTPTPPALPDSQQLGVRLPAAAPDVLPLLTAATPGAAGASRLGVPLETPASTAGQTPGAGQQQQGGGAGATGSKGPDGKKPEEEKTWLQKNWMMVAPLGFILLNILGNGMGAQQQQQQQQRPGGAPVRVAARR